jgi:probable rRNA maturation factor
MMKKINITFKNILLQVDKKWEKEVDSQRLKQAILMTLKLEQIRKEVQLSLVIVGDEEMTRLHESYRSESGTTDVLTFAYEDEADNEEMRGYLGDIIVSYEQAIRQANREGHKTQDELALLAVHGTLHLLGYDDETLAEKEEMWQQQYQVMQALGLGSVAPTLS